MKLSQLMKGITPNPDYIGVDIADNTVVAINPSKQGVSTFDEFIVFRQAVTEISPTFESQTTETTYYGTGTNVTKTGTNFSISVTGDRYMGDEAQDLIFDLDNIQAIGADAIYELVCFNINTGKGYAGTFTAAQEQNSGGSAGENAPATVTFNKIAMNPVKFDYVNDKGKTFDELITPSVTVLEEGSYEV